MNHLDSGAWNFLKTTPPKGDLITARLAAPEISERLLAGIDAEGNRHFLILLPSDDIPFNDNQSRGISVSCKDLQVKDLTRGLQPAKYIDIICNDASGYEAFDLIGREIAILLVSHEISPSEIVRNVLAKWRRFWNQPLKDILSREEIIGLFAELWFFHYWLLPHKTKETAVACWRGPYGSRHDFEWLGQSVEVKATTSTRGRIHRINGLEQLSPPENGKLALFSLRLREEDGATNTLPNLINLCRDALQESADALTDFENALASIGYSPMHDEEYEKIHLRIVDETLFSVQDNFPRITKDKFQDGVPIGVEMVNYEINLEGYDKLIIARKPQEMAINF
jgi:hypothetical protein